MDDILRVSPSFDRTWREFLSEWEHQPGELPLYLVLSELARHISRLYAQGADSELRLIFSIVENWHLNGDAYVREAATIGLLENLQNTNVVGLDLPAKLVQYLGPESRRWWTKVERFWERGELIRDK